MRVVCAKVWCTAEREFAIDRLVPAAIDRARGEKRVWGRLYF